ncbi:unnamed protein product [Malus baccata var. baccata]
MSSKDENPFWRLWNPAGSDGRGVIGVLEANFVEPAHDKEGFELTTVLSRPEIKLTVGNAPRRRTTDFPEGEPLVSGRGKSCLVNQNRHGSKFNNKLEKGSSPVNASSEDGSCYEVLHSSIDPSTILLQMKESLKCVSVHSQRHFILPSLLTYAYLCFRSLVCLVVAANAKELKDSCGPDG